MSLQTLLNQWKKDPGIGPNISAWLTIEKRDPAWAEIPPGLDPRLVSYLASQGIQRLYQHQFASWESIQLGENVVLSTGTASGKSLAYQLPVVDRILKNERSKSLFLFPTKALARDQLAWLNGVPGISAAAYDGDTPTNQRKSIRENADIIISNPDMLHLGILPYHVQWGEFFSSLDFIVLDEIHIYRGVFGSHVANLLRRIKRITAHYGAKPQFILTSATIGNPLQLGQSLIEEDLSLLNEDSSSRGEKHFLIYNPPVIDPKFGLRASMHKETLRLAEDLLTNGQQTIIFAKSRRSVEFLLTRLKERSSFPPSSLQSYRSGYLPSQRRKLEADLRSGEIRCITATTALELGIDIGGLDASLLAGYPGSIASTWQQAGRSGRGDQSSLSLLALSANPLDQYIGLFPEFLFSSHPESALINPDNLLILLSHLKCAAYELPFQDGEVFGSALAENTAELLSILEMDGVLHRSGDTYFWMSEDYPAAEISLRSTSHQQIALSVIDVNGRSSLVGTIDKESALWMVHPGAVYFHQGENYFVKDLDLDQNKAVLSSHHEDYYTEAVKHVEFEILSLQGEEEISGAKKYFGEIQATSQVSSFKKINWKRYEVIGTENLSLPPTILTGMGFWLGLSPAAEEQLRDSGDWNSSPNEYGGNWKAIRHQVLERDRNQCGVCGKEFPTSSLHVHHRVPLRQFTSLKEANQLTNLISLCPRCHQRAETVVRVNSGLSGLGHLLHHLAPLLLMCDPSDLGLYADFSSTLSEGRPTVLLYEQVPAGIGFSHYLYKYLPELLRNAQSVIAGCSCENGCPGCVGPGGELGSGGKFETGAILNILCS